ncbi:MAG: cbb3-type cytochrome c oxidase subunit II, partial [Ectothiorhodospiraceae bacterium]|nr:cbb3-type cytochrome c oxidase subunit II [Ectothiorhodospiraceae bacterium]
HLLNPRDVVPESNMPSYPWLAERTLDGETVARRMRAQRRWLNVPYTDEPLEQAAGVVDGKTEMEAIIAYLQSLGTAVERTR